MSQLFLWLSRTFFCFDDRNNLVGCQAKNYRVRSKKSKNQWLNNDGTNVRVLVLSCEKLNVLEIVIGHMAKKHWPISLGSSLGLSVKIKN